MEGAATLIIAISGAATWNSTKPMIAVYDLKIRGDAIEKIKE